MDKSLTRLKCSSIALIVLSLCLSCQCLREISCGRQYTGDTKASFDGLALYSFTVNENITAIWLDLCGSTFDTVISIYNGSQRLQFDDDSDECGYQTVSQISTTNYVHGSYIANISGYAGDAGYYILKVSCNEYHKPVYPALDQCNHVFYYPAEICWNFAYFYMSDNSNDSLHTELEAMSSSMRLGCSEDNVAAIYYYEESQCIGDYNMTLEPNASSKCDTNSTCSYVKVQSQETCDIDILSALYEQLNDSMWSDRIQIADTCLPGNVKWFCSEWEYYQKTYYDENCTRYFRDGERYQLGCNQLADGSDMYVNKIECHLFNHTDFRTTTDWRTTGLYSSDVPEITKKEETVDEWTSVNVFMIVSGVLIVIICVGGCLCLWYTQSMKKKFTTPKEIEGKSEPLLKKDTDYGAEGCVQMADDANTHYVH